MRSELGTFCPLRPYNALSVTWLTDRIFPMRMPLSDGYYRKTNHVAHPVPIYLLPSCILDLPILRPMRGSITVYHRDCWLSFIKKYRGSLHNNKRHRHSLHIIYQHRSSTRRHPPEIFPSTGPLGISLWWMDEPTKPWIVPITLILAYSTTFGTPPPRQIRQMLVHQQQRIRSCSSFIHPPLTWPNVK